MTDQLAEQLPEPRMPETMHEAIAPDAQMARKNNIWGWTLLGVSVLLFFGTIGLALVYLALD